MRFRSPYLQTYPTNENKSRLQTLDRHTVVFGTLLTLIGFPCFLVWQRIPPSDGWGYPLYWCHDFVYLPLKGYLYTYFFPWSLIWFALLGLAFLPLVYYYVSQQSLFRPIHLFLLDQALRRSSLYPSLLASARWAQRFQIRPRQMATAAELVRRESLDQLIADPSKKGLASFLAKLSCFEQELAPLAEVAPVHRALAAQEVFLVLRAALRPEESGLLVQLAESIAQVVPQLRRPVLSEQGSEAEAMMPLASSAAVHGPFSEESFGLDLLYLAMLVAPNLAIQIPGGPRADLPRQDLEHQTAQRLAHSMAERRRAIDRLRSNLEDRFLRFRPSATQVKLGLADSGPDNLGDWGQLALGLALDRASLDQHPDPLLIFMDSIEGLRLALALAPLDPENEDPELTELQYLLGQTPLPRHYRAAARLTGQAQNRSRSQWRASGLEKAGYLLKSDFELGDDRVWSLELAAGPDLMASTTQKGGSPFEP